MAFRPLGCPYGRELVGVKGDRSRRKCPKQMGAAMRRQRWGWGGVGHNFLKAWAWPVGDVDEDSGN